MDIYHSTVDYLSGFPMFDSWPEMKEILQRAADLCPRDWKLPVIACQSLGKPQEKAIPASAALACAQISIILVDDMLDNDPRGEFHHIGSGRAANLAIAFQSAGVQALIGSQTGSSVRLEATNSLNQMMLTTAHGQNLDVQNPADEAAYWRVVENKSSPFYGYALHLGALIGGASERDAATLLQLGRLYGEMIQIHDDMNDSMAIPANADWKQRRCSLPVLFALTAEHPDLQQFRELHQNISNEHDLQEAQEILIRCGSLSYCIDQLLRRHKTARVMLSKHPLPNQAAVDSLMEGVIAPVYKLFESLGISSEIALTLDTGWSRE